VHGSGIGRDRPGSLERGQTVHPSRRHDDDEIARPGLRSNEAARIQPGIADKKEPRNRESAAGGECGVHQRDRGMPAATLQHLPRPITPSSLRRRKIAWRARAPAGADRRE